MPTVATACDRTFCTVTPSLVNAATTRHYLTAVWCVLALGACATASPRPPATPGTTTAPVAAAHAEHAEHAEPAAAPTAATAGAMDHHEHGAGSGPVTIPAGALYTEADVRFMQGMIAHHAQAIHMSRLAAGHGASPRLVRLAQKIDLSQAGEITLMQDWLVANGQFAPDTSSWRTTVMHGMLTAEEIERLEAASGTEFDRMFLEYMIRHHEGALAMVADLMATPRAAQDVDVSVLANDVETTQTAEIGLMLQMLMDF